MKLRLRVRRTLPIGMKHGRGLSSQAESVKRRLGGGWDRLTLIIQKHDYGQTYVNTSREGIVGPERKRERGRRYCSKVKEKKEGTAKVQEKSGGVGSDRGGSSFQSVDRKSCRRPTRMDRETTGGGNLKGKKEAFKTRPL